MVLLSHYFQPDNPVEVQQAALKDWVSALAPFPQNVIERACDRYLRNQPRRRPTPGDIRAICQARQETKSDSLAPQGDRSRLTYEQLELLETKVLPTARRWATEKRFRGIAHHGRQTLAYWGEEVPNVSWELSEREHESKMHELKELRERISLQMEAAE